MAVGIVLSEEDAVDGIRVDSDVRAEMVKDRLAVHFGPPVAAVVSRAMSERLKLEPLSGGNGNRIIVESPECDERHRGIVGIAVPFRIPTELAAVIHYDRERDAEVSAIAGTLSAGLPLPESAPV